MIKPFERIIQILDMERQNGYSNRAIIGGLDKFLPTLLRELVNQNSSSSIQKSIEEFFTTYPGLSIEKRKKLSTNLINSIKQDSPGSPSVQILENPLVESVKQKSKIQPQSIQKNISNTATLKKERVLHGFKAPLHTLPGIGPSKTTDFKSIGVNTVEDLFYYFPRRYDDYSQLKPINRLQYGDVLTIIATVQSVSSTKMKNKGLTRVEVVVSDGTGFLRLLFFRGSLYVSSFISQFSRGRQLVISGKVDMYLGRLEMTNPGFEDLDQDHLSTNGIIPVYPLISGLSQKLVRNAIKHSIDFYANKIIDFLPQGIISKAGIVDLSSAISNIHYPSSQKTLKSAQDRLAFDEIFMLQIGVLQQKRIWTSQPSQKYEISDDILNAFISQLPFSLTNAQNKVISEVRKDLVRGTPMNRLLQGDVGSGKTIVAAISGLILAKNHSQTAFMAPTSILAEQHYQSLQKLFSKDKMEALEKEWNISVSLLTGDTPTKERETIHQGLVDGTIDILIGTHALLEEPVKFKNLQLAIIDEQHRFGVTQRAELRSKGENPHLLVMTATPIPRSLALTLYGDLDLSIMDEMPSGRKPVSTHILSPLERERGYQIIRGQISEGHQAFIVYPLIDQGENDEVKAAVADHDLLQNEIFPDLKVGLLHGKMVPAEKEKVMSSFRSKEFQILVSTTVIEVGVDVPNATVMLIEGANRFGLAQLHQLRGRVGRGSDQSLCLLIPDTEDAVENERLKVMTETNDGFILAEKDLQQRGPGDFIGYRQSGFAELKMASITDIHLIEKARTIAQELFENDPMLEKTENGLLLTKLTEFWNANTMDIS